ncbi:MAG: translocation/assembly module TamB [Candidatus Cloacimonetes bacterium]|nr:translocation/assembly module TamB [Candidatus Cloacimonadota bacterium]
MKFNIKSILKHTSIVLITLIFLLFLSIQTQFFKDWIKNYITKIVEQATGYELIVEDLRGNLLSNITLSDITLYSNSDTLLSIAKVTTEYNTFEIFNKKIDINKLEIESPFINLQKLLDLDPSHTTEINQSKNVTSQAKSFDYKIVVATIKLNNGSFEFPADNDNIPQIANNINFEASFDYHIGNLIFNLNNFNLITEKPPYTVEQLAFDFNKQGDSIKVNNLNFHTKKNSLYGQIRYSSPNSLKLKLKSKPLYLAEFKNLFPTISPSLNPQIVLDVTHQSDSLIIDLSATGNEQKVNLLFNSEGVSDIINEKIGKNFKYKLTGNFSNISSEQWINSEDSSYIINGSFKVTGSGIKKESLNAKFTTSLYNSRLRGYDISDLEVKTTISGNNLMGGITAKGDFGRLGLDANITDLWKTPKYRVNLYTKNFNTDAIFKKEYYTSNINLTSSITGEGLDPKKLTAQGKLNINRSSWENYQIQSVNSTFEFDNKQLTVDTLYLQSKAVEFGLSGTGNTEGDVDIKLFTEIKETEPFQKFFPIKSLCTSGYLSASIKGNIDSLNTSSRLKLNNSNYQGNSIETIDLSVSAALKKQLTEGTATLNLNNIKAKDHNIDTINLVTEFQNKTLNLDLNIHQKDNFAHLRSSIFLDSNPEIVITDATINYMDQKWRKIGEDTKIILNENDYLIKNFKFVEQTQGETQSISANGVISKEGREDFKLLVSNIDTKIFKDVFRLPANIGGTLNLELSLLGIAQEPLIIGKISIENGSINNYQYNSFKGNFNYRNEQLTWDFLLQSEKATAIVIDGNTSFKYSFPNQLVNLNKDTPFQFRVKAEKFPVSLVKAANFPIKEFSGNGACDINVKGTIKNPQITGEFSINNGFLSAPKYGVKYQHIDMNLSLNNKTLRLDKMYLKGSKGDFNIKGELGFKTNLLNHDIEQLYFNFNAKNFYVTNHDDHQLQITGNGFINGSIEKPNFGGELIVLRSFINLAAFTKNKDQVDTPYFKSEPLLVQAQNKKVEKVDTVKIKSQSATTDDKQFDSEFFNNLRGNYTIKIPRNTWLKNQNLRTELSGELNLMKDRSNMKIFGVINIMRGHYDLLSKRFRIKEGQITFVGNKIPNPTVKLIAEYTFRTPERDKKNLELIVSGNIRQPDIQFFLDNEKLNEGDAVAYIIFGRNLGQLSTGQQKEVETSYDQISEADMAKNVAANLLSTEITKLLSKQLNLDYIEIKINDQWQSASFVFGKYISDNLFVSYQRGLSATDDANNLTEFVSLDYQLTKIIYLQLTGHYKYSGFDVIFQFQNE